MADKAVAPASIADLESLPEDELAAKLGREMLLLSAQLARNPGRNAIAQNSAIRTVLEYCKAKPAAKIDLNHSGSVEITAAETLRRRRQERLSKAE